MPSFLSIILLLLCTSSPLSVPMYGTPVGNTNGTLKNNKLSGFNEKEIQSTRTSIKASNKLLDNHRLTFGSPSYLHPDELLSTTKERIYDFPPFNITSAARQGVETGLSGDRCTYSSQCKGARVCKENILNATRCVPKNGSLKPCGCGCGKVFTCPIGEFCINHRDENVCLSLRCAVEIGRVSGLPSPGGSGLTGDECSFSADCKDLRVCIRWGSHTSSSQCFPSSGQHQNCTTSADCNTGEGCISTTTSGEWSCMSLAFFQKIGIMGPPSPGGNASTLDKCSTSADCTGPRFCVQNISGESRCVPPHRFKNCVTSSNCVEGEVCFLHRRPAAHIRCVAPEAFFECLLSGVCIEGRNGLCLIVTGYGTCAGNDSAKELGLSIIDEWSGLPSVTEIPVLDMV